MSVSWLELLLLILASFRLTRLIVFDTITQFLRSPFLEVIEETLPDGTVASYIQVKGTGIRKFFGELLSCYWCTGFWCSLVIVLGYLWYPFIMYPFILIFAVAGAASFLETILGKLVED
ncbi:sporulation protein [Anaerobacillus alkalilacustris]|uniref:Sporulation protein n=1 Tax=Anaerobacillus alkalilacustris TaxID=393763 RepID=A0A1S2LDG3_9BACI|nr:DUF1360 domain-containing protein [Anaerobacillus alkalilacustris]OIJ10421.1 sporulation protein [Anaerobacillus alkalilacustris]